MTTNYINFTLIARLLTALTKFSLILVMLFSIVILFFIGSGVLKPSKGWELITKEEGMK